MQQAGACHDFSPPDQATAAPVELPSGFRNAYFNGGHVSGVRHFHSGGLNMLCCDGSVHFINYEVSIENSLLKASGLYFVRISPPPLGNPVQFISGALNPCS